MFKTSLLLAGLTYLASAQEVTNCAEPTTLFGELKRSFLGQSEDAVTDCVLADTTNSTMEVSQATLDAEMNLYNWNVWMGVAHFVQAAGILVLSFTVTNIKDFKFPMVTHFLDWANGYPQLATQERFDLPLAAAASIFSFLSALFHGIVVLNFDTYTHDLRRGINKFRWWEYALSSSVMIALISMLFGVYDIMNLIGIVAINASMNLFGLVFEVMNADLRDAGNDEVDWSAFIYGCFAGLIPWVQLYTPLFASGNLGEVPNFVWGILVSYFIFFNTFPVNMYLQYNQVGKWNDELYPDMNNGGYYYGEKVYQVLSLAAKSILIWFVVAGTAQPQENSVAILTAL